MLSNQAHLSEINGLEFRLMKIGMFCRIRGDQQHFVRRDELKVRSVYASTHMLLQKGFVFLKTQNPT